VLSIWWDLVQVVFIAWVATVVPLRLGFDKTVPFHSVEFWIDVGIDTFFIVDIFLNCTAVPSAATALLWEMRLEICCANFFLCWCMTVRTAYWLPTGFLETNPKAIFKHVNRLQHLSNRL
jgi:hypothetical protein